MRRLAPLVVLLALAAPASAQAALVTGDLSGPLEPADLAGALAGQGVSVSNVRWTGAEPAGGTFAGGTGIVGFESGVVLSSGNVASVVGPNANDGTSTAHLTPGDPALTSLAGFETFDAAVLEFDFVPNASQVTFRYVFGSEEYNEFANGSVNDVFAFFVNGANCAMVPGTESPVSVNTVNGGNPFGQNAQNAHLFRNNDLSDGGGAIDTELDGLTTVFTCVAAVTPNAANTMRLAIADGGDSVLDADVFIQAGSLTTAPPEPPPGTPPPNTPPPTTPTDPGQRDPLPPHILQADSIDELPDPEPFREANVEHDGGQVFVRLPGQVKRAGAAQSFPGAPKGFVPLTRAAQLPLGTIVETARGRVKLESAFNRTGTRTQLARFFSGRFQIVQRRARRPVTELRVKGGSFRSACRRSRAAGDGPDAGIARHRGRRVRRLWGSGRGRFRTRGRYSSATVRGTKWLVEDTCNGTLTRLARRPRTSRVTVRDFVARRTIRLRAGEGYFAAKRR